MSFGSRRGSSARSSTNTSVRSAPHTPQLGGMSTSSLCCAGRQLGGASTRAPMPPPAPTALAPMRRSVEALDVRRSGELRGRAPWSAKTDVTLTRLSQVGLTDVQTEPAAPLLPPTDTRLTATPGELYHASILTPQQIESSLLRWLTANRRLHETRKQTLLRALTQGTSVPIGANGVPSGVRVSANFPLTRPRPPPVVSIAAPEKAPSSSARSLTASAEGAEKVDRVERVTDPDDPLADQDTSLRESGALSPTETSQERDASATPPAAEEERAAIPTEGERAAIAVEVEAEFHRRSRAEQRAHAGVKHAYYSSDASLVVPPEVLDGVWLKPNPDTSRAEWLGYQAQSEKRRHQERERHLQEKVNAGPAPSLSPKEFSAACNIMGIAVREPEVARLFHKHAFGRPSNTLALERFVDALLGVATGAAAGGEEAEAEVTRRGPLGKEAAHGFKGKVMYAPCRTLVRAPTDWDGETAKRSQEVPSAELRLEHVYGFNGALAGTRLLCTASGELLYTAAAVGVVTDPVTRHQRFFRGHNDDVTSLALHPKGQLAATGQMGHAPYACVWDTTSDACREVSRLAHAKGETVVALAFTADGNRLITVGVLAKFNIHVWDWRRGSKQIAGPSWNGTLPVVNLGLACSPAKAPKGAQEFVVYSGKAMKWWVLTSVLESRAASFGTDMPPEEIRCAAYLEDGRLLTGHPSGIRQWADHTCVRIVLCASGINSLLVLSRANVVLSGAQDGQIQQWDCSGRNLLPVKLKEKPKVPKADSSKPAPRIPPITSLAARTDHTIVPEVFFGTKSLCIWRMKQEETAAPTVLLPGHAAAVQMVAFHPTQSSVFATVGDDGNVVVWDGQTHTARGWIRMGRQAAAHCLAFSSDGEHLAVGLSDGRLRVFEMPADQPQPTFSSGGNMELGTDDYPLVFGASVSKGALSDLKYSPDNRYLAVAYMMAVDIFAVGRDHTGVTYTPLSKCTGHSSVVKHVDFSTDGRLLRTNSQGYEILHYDARTGAQVVGDHRDQSWHTWSCVLGFPVMGIFRSDMDGTDVNACHRSASGALVVAADDDGCVRLLNYPAVVCDSGVRTYGGHSSHCVCVRFSADDRWVVSVGSRDQTVMQWRVLNAPLASAPASTVESTSGGDGGVEPDAQSTGVAGLMERKSSATRYTKNRMAVLEEEMKQALTKQVEKKSRVRKAKEAPTGKLWGPLDSTGKRFGWIASDSPLALAAAMVTEEPSPPTDPRADVNGESAASSLVSSTAASITEATESSVAGIEASRWDALSDSDSDASALTSTETSSIFSTGAAYQNPLMKTMRPPVLEEGSESSSWATDNNEASVS